MMLCTVGFGQAELCGNHAHIVTVPMQLSHFLAIENHSKSRARHLTTVPTRTNALDIYISRNNVLYTLHTSTRSCSDIPNLRQSVHHSSSRAFLYKPVSPLSRQICKARRISFEESD